MDRDEIEFDLRFGVRVLERHVAMWSRLDVATSAVSFLAGTAAFAAIVAQHAWLALFIGALLAVAQAIQLILRPMEKGAIAKLELAMWRKGQAAALSQPVDQAANTVRQLRANSQVEDPTWLRFLAFNDLIDEMGLDRAYRKPVSTVGRLGDALLN